MGRRWLAAEGYDSTYGARPLKRMIQRSPQNPLAGMILEGVVKAGDTVHVSGGKQGLMINPPVRSLSAARDSTKVFPSGKISAGRVQYLPYSSRSGRISLNFPSMWRYLPAR